MNRYYIAAGVVLIAALVWAYHLDTECEAAGGVLVRGAIKLVCVHHLEVIK